MDFLILCVFDAILFVFCLLWDSVLDLNDWRWVRS